MKYLKAVWKIYRSSVTGCVLAVALVSTAVLTWSGT